MRLMPGAGYHRHIDRAVAFLFGNLDLTNCPILVGFALQNCDRNTNVSEIVADVPSTKVGVEPGVIPAVKGVVGIVMPARKFGSQVGRFVAPSDLGDRGNRDVLDDKM